MIYGKDPRTERWRAYAQHLLRPTRVFELSGGLFPLVKDIANSRNTMRALTPSVPQLFGFIWSQRAHCQDQKVASATDSSKYNSRYMHDILAKLLLHAGTGVSRWLSIRSCDSLLTAVLSHLRIPHSLSGQAKSYQRSPALWFSEPDPCQCHAMDAAYACKSTYRPDLGAEVSALAD